MIGNAMKGHCTYRKIAVDKISAFVFPHSISLCFLMFQTFSRKRRYTSEFNSDITIEIAFTIYWNYQ